MIQIHRNHKSLAEWHYGMVHRHIVTVVFFYLDVLLKIWHGKINSAGGLSAYKPGYIDAGTCKQLKTLFISRRKKTKLSSFYTKNYKLLFEALLIFFPETGTLKKIITASFNPSGDSLLNIEDQVLKEIDRVGRGFFRHKNNRNHLELLIKKIFDYDRFISITGFKTKKGEYSAYDLARKLNVNVCPYCNRQYTQTVMDNNERVIRPQFDHVHSKKPHFLLAISYFNLLPCCGYCNQLKSDKPINESEFLHPYYEGFNEHLKFTFYPQNHNILTGELNGNITVDIIPENCQPGKLLGATKNIDLFALKEIYGYAHRNRIEHIMRLKKKKADVFLRFIKRRFGIFDSLDEVYYLAFGKHYNYQFHEEEVLSKFSRDIFEEVFPKKNYPYIYK